MLRIHASLIQLTLLLMSWTWYASQRSSPNRELGLVVPLFSARQFRKIHHYSMFAETTVSI